MTMMEIMKCPTCHIIQLTLDADMSMLGISTGFLNFFMPLHHHFFLRYIRESLAESLQLEHDRQCQYYEEKQISWTWE